MGEEEKMISADEIMLAHEARKRERESKNPNYKTGYGLR